MRPALVNIDLKQFYRGVYQLLNRLVMVLVKGILRYKLVIINNSNDGYCTHAAGS